MRRGDVLKRGRGRQVPSPFYRHFLRKKRERKGKGGVGGRAFADNFVYDDGGFMYFLVLVRIFMQLKSSLNGNVLMSDIV